MCVTCRNCEAEVANKDRATHDCIKSLKALVSRQQATINRQNETINKLERELKVFKMDDMSNPYSIDRVALNNNQSELLGQIEGYDRILAEISARQHQIMNLDPSEEYEELKQQIRTYSDFVDESVPQFKNKCP